MAESRIKNSRRNILSGIIKQMINLILAFAVRTITLYVLGADYQGLSGLFASILQVLSLTDLGFSTAVIFLLYKPIADKDIERVCAIVYFLKKIYYVIGAVIFAAGLAIMPLLKHLIFGQAPSGINIYVLFLLYLFNTAVSYMLFAYKSALLTAMQRQDIENNIYIVTTILVRITQILVIVLLKNYYVFVAVIPVGTILNNILLQIESKIFFPEIIPYGKIPKETRNAFNKQIKAVFWGKIGDVARNSFDNIMISALLGLVAVAVYDNYYYVYSALYGIMGIIIHGMSASVGNAIATADVKKNYLDMQKLNFLFMWIAGWCSICMFSLYQPFMRIWMKNSTDMLLDFWNMTLFCIYFYVINMTYVRSMYLEGNGLFYECRVWFVIEAVGNLLLNVLLGCLWGITGILLATIITIIFFNFICRTNILFKHYFKNTPWGFYRQHALYFVITVFTAIVTYFLCCFIKQGDFKALAVKSLICLIVPNAIYFFCYRKYRLFSEALVIVKRVLDFK